MAVATVAITVVAATAGPRSAGWCTLSLLDPDPRANQPLGGSLAGDRFGDAHAGNDGAGRAGGGFAGAGFTSAGGGDAVAGGDGRDTAGGGRRRWWLVFNGEIYNFRELRAALERDRRVTHWRTTGDTEALLYHLASRWDDDHPEAALDAVNGMYALALWDAQRGRLMLARDRMGQKPLYVAEAPGAGGGVGAVAFASELAALRQVPWFDGRVDHEAIEDYLRYGYMPSPRTAYLGARSVEPATMELWQGGAVSTRVYWNAAAGRAGAGGDADAAGVHDAADVARQSRRLIEQAVERQMVSDVPVGCFLSGGIDSSIVALAMQKVARRTGVGAGRVMTFTAQFDDPRYDESPFAARVAAHLGTVHRVFPIRPDAAADLPRLAAAYGEPFGDSSALPTYYLARATRADSKVALGGDGGDELFGGYDRYRAMRLGQRVPDAVRMMRPLTAMRVYSMIGGSHPKSRRSRLKRFLSTIDLPAAARYRSYVRLFDDAALAALYGRPPGASGLERRMNAVFEAMTSAGKDAAGAAMAVDRDTYLPFDLLTKVDRASMRHALEVRAPFMDHELVAFAAALPSRLLIDRRSGKLPLRTAFASELPAEVFDRPKMGFALPIGEWFRRPLKPMLNDLLTAGSSYCSAHLQPAAVKKLVAEHDSRIVDHTQRLFALLMLELWWASR